MCLGLCILLIFYRKLCSNLYPSPFFPWSSASDLIFKYHKIFLVQKICFNNWIYCRILDDLRISYLLWNWQKGVLKWEYMVYRKLLLQLQKLDIPTRIGHTDSTQSWFINPMGKKKPMPLWLMFVAVIPAFLIFLLLFLESQLTQWVIFSNRFLFHYLCK